LSFPGIEPVWRGGALYRRGVNLLVATDRHAIARRAGAIALVIRVGSAGLAYVAQVVFARLMGQFEYGLFAYTSVWFLVFAAVASLGFGDSPVRYIAQLRERGEIDYLRGFLRFSALVIIVASVTFSALLVIALPIADRYIDHAYLMPMALMAISIPIACLQSLLEGVGRSYNWTLPALLPVYIIRHGLLLAIMTGAVALGVEATAVNAFICFALTMVLSLAYQATAILRRLRKVVEPGPRAYRSKEWLRGSLPFAVLYAAQHLSSFADVLVLSFFVSPAEIAVYFAATRIMQVVNLIPYATTVGTAHLYSASHTRGDHDDVQRLVRHAVVINFVIAAIAVGLLVALGDWLLGMFGPGFEAGYVPLVILGVGVLARVAAGPVEDILNMTGYGGVSAWAYIVAVAANVVLALILIGPFGLDGAAIAASCALVLKSLSMSISVRRRLGIRTSIISAASTWFGAIGSHNAHRRAPAE